MFINKPQIWDLNNYLTWNNLRNTFHDKKNILKIMQMNCCWNTMLGKLNQSACSAPKSHPQKFQIFEKVLPREQGLSEGQIFTLNFI